MASISKKYLEYFYDPTGVSKLIRYDLYIRLTSTPRNSISIITKKYLERYKRNDSFFSLILKLVVLKK